MTSIAMLIIHLALRLVTWWGFVISECVLCFELVICYARYHFLQLYTQLSVTLKSC